MIRSELLQFIRRHKLAVEASVSPGSGPQAAVVGFVINDTFEIFFDTSGLSRKAENLRLNTRIAFVIGGLSAADEQTVQYEGVADEPSGAELAAFKELYFSAFPDGREREKGQDIAYFRAKPVWIRFSDFKEPNEIVEFEFADKE